MKKFYRDVRLTEFEEKALTNKMLKIWEYIYRNPNEQVNLVDIDCFSEGNIGIGIAMLEELKNTTCFYSPEELTGTETNLTIFACISSMEDTIDIELKKDTSFMDKPATAIIFKTPYYLTSHCYSVIHDGILLFMQQHPEL